jgi:hypothetical protein
MGAASSLSAQIEGGMSGGPLPQIPTWRKIKQQGLRRFIAEDEPC